MPVVRVHRYRVSPDRLDDLLQQRAVVIDGIRRGHPGLTETRLVRLEDGSFLDTWRWESAEQMIAAVAASQGFPLVGATMALTEEATADNGEVIDER